MGGAHPGASRGRADKHVGEPTTAPIYLYCMKGFQAFVLLGLLLPQFAGAQIAKTEFQARRAELQKSLKGPLVLYGRDEMIDGMYRALPELNFYYLTGWSEADAILLLTPSSETLFLPHRNARREIYEGHHVAADDADAVEVTGFRNIAPVDKFADALKKASESAEKAYALPGDKNYGEIGAISRHEVVSAVPLINALRVKKSAGEIAAIEHTTDVSAAAHRAAWKHLSPGAHEYDGVAAFTGALLNAGCEGHSYAPIFGSGPNALTLHYDADSRRMDAGELIVIDAAARCNYYTSDITRTLPVNGKFTPRQRELYNIVLGAQKAAIAAVKPGAMISGDRSLNAIAKEYLNTHGKDLHGQPLGKYLPHGISHHVGLDVHDSMFSGPLTPGMVITIEPGLYIPEEGIGIRIEDTVLVTEDGCKVLSAALPREADEIEKALAK